MKASEGPRARVMCRPRDTASNQTVRRAMAGGRTGAGEVDGTVLGRAPRRPFGFTSDFNSFTSPSPERAGARTGAAAFVATFADPVARWAARRSIRAWFSPIWGAHR